jgi:hypothetical protein
MEEVIKEEVQKLMELEGEVRGVTLIIDRDYILKNKGEEGLKRIEEELRRLGHPIKYKEIETFSYYPVGLRALSLLAIKKVFNFNDEKIKEIGFFGTKVSLIIKFFIKYVFSAQKVFLQEGPRIWREHWTIGRLVPVKLDEEKKYAVLQVKDFKLHPIYCVFLSGYLSGLFSMIVKSPKITCQETKCSFKGNEYHEYLIKWQ